MIMMRKLIILFAFFVVMSCAVIKSPEGGPLDKSAPKVINENPSSGTVNFNSQRIVISFNEYISIQNSQNIVISPLFKNQPKIKTKRKSIIINTDKCVDSNTTYNIMFNNTIADVTEGNQLKNYNYVFSTGKSIDSFSIKGIIHDAKTKQKLSNITVFLLKQPYDSFFNGFNKRNNLIAGISKTLEDGSFLINNIRKDDYYILAFEDLNNNLKYEQDEKVGFLLNKINPAVDTMINLGIFYSYPKSKKISESIFISENVLKIIFNQPVNIKKVLLFDSLMNYQKVNYCVNETKDTSLFWTENSITDLYKLNVEFNDGTSDSLIIKNTVKQKNLEQKVTVSNDLYGLTQSIRFDFKQPIISLDKTNIFIYEDSNDVTENFNILISPFCATELMIKGDFTNNKIIINKNAIEVLNNKSDSICYKINTFKDDELGSIKILVTNNTDSDCIIYELLSKENKIIRKGDINSKKKNIEFSDLIPGTYRLRFIFDENGNNIWDRGNIYTHTQPEKIFYPIQEFNLKPNWELEDIKIEIKK